jgi:Zn-dependent M28 family amino/carboxypeptidase
MTESGTLEAALRGHVRALCDDIGPRCIPQGDSLDRAALYIRQGFESAGLRVAEQPYDYHGRRVANLIAVPPGAGKDSAYYVVGAHYDTVPGTPGADDNASAVAVLLELARRLPAAPPPLRLVAFTLEEPPVHLTRRQGSRVFLRAAAQNGERVLGAVVLEMVGYTCPEQTYPLVLKWAGYPKTGDFIGIVRNRRSRRFGRSVHKGFRRNPRLPVETLTVPFDGWILPETRLSDHASFWDARLPAVMVTDTAFFRNPNYHLPSDRPETLDYGFMAEVVRSLELAIGTFASGPRES